MPTTKIAEIEERVRVLEGQMVSNGMAMETLTDRVDAIAQSLTRIESVITRFEKGSHAFMHIVKTLFRWLKLGIGIMAASALTAAATYVITHFFR